MVEIFVRKFMIAWRNVV